VTGREAAKLDVVLVVSVVVVDSCLELRPADGVVRVSCTSFCTWTPPVSSTNIEL